MRVRNRLAVAGLLALATACASEPAPTRPEPNLPPPPRMSPAPSAQNDQCGAREAQVYVGRPRTEIPVPVQPGLQRVACTTCPVTHDFAPRRLNFFFDAETGVVKEVRCG